MRTVVCALVRPVLTWVCVTLPAWLDAWTREAPAVMPAAWRARQRYEEGKEGDRL